MDQMLETITSWWFQLIWKILVKLDHLLRDRGKNKNYLKPTPRSLYRCNFVAASWSRNTGFFRTRQNHQRPRHQRLLGYHVLFHVAFSETPKNPNPINTVHTHTHNFHPGPNVASYEWPGGQRSVMTHKTKVQLGWKAFPQGCHGN